MSHNDCIGRNSNYADRDGPPPGPRPQAYGNTQGRPRYNSYVPRGDPFASTRQQDALPRTDLGPESFSPSGRRQSYYSTQAPSGPHYDKTSGMTPAKRNASRSPDGSNEHKKAARAGSISKDAGERRQQSSKNTNLVNPSADPRKRVERNNTSVQSPVSTDGSTYQDAASTRSTPQPQQQQPKPQTALTVTVPNTPISQDGNPLQASLQDSIATLVSHMAADASVRASHDLAKHKLEGATAVYESMQNHFQKYPGIEERTSNDKSKAFETVTKLDQQLKGNSNIQATLASSLFEVMWTISSKASTSAQVQGLHPDAVSRKEYDLLQDQFKEQQSLLAKQQDQFEKQASLIKELEKTVTQANEAAVKSNNQASVTDRNTKMVNAPDSLLRKVESTVSSQSIAIEQCESKLAQNKSDIAARQATLTEIDRSIKSATSLISTSREDHGKLERRVTAMKNEVTVMKNEVSQIWDEISEQGKPAVVQRLKSHDVNINNLWTKVDPSTKPIDFARMQLLEERLESLTQHLNEIKEAKVKEPREATAQVSTDASLPFDVDKFKQQIFEDSTELVEELSKSFDSHTAEIAQLQEDLRTLQEKLEESKHDYTGKIRQLDSAHNDKHALAHEDRERMSAVITTHKDKADALQSGLESLEQTVKSLQDRPSTATVNGTNAVQFRPITTQSPTVSSPIAGVSPRMPHSTNVLPSNGAAVPQATANGNPVVPNAYEIRTLQDQMTAAWATINNLRQRYDNLTTDEVVKSMVDQFSKMYPAAKDFNRVATTLQMVDKGLDGRVSALGEKLGSFQNDLNLLRSEFNEDLMKQLASDGKGEARFRELQKGLDDAGRATAELRDEIVKTVKDAEKRVDAAVSCQTDTIVKIRSEVKALADIAFGEEEGEKKKPGKGRGNHNGEEDEDDDL